MRIPGLAIGSGAAAAPSSGPSPPIRPGRARSRLRRVLGWTATLGSAATLGSLPPSTLLAQEADSAAVEPARAERQVADGPVSPDSADSLRAAMERPPSRPPADVHDVLSFPLRVAMLPLAVVGKGIQGAVLFLFRPGPPNPVALAIRDVREWGLSPDVSTFGPRSGPGAELRLERFDPFFLETGLSIRGSQRHAIGLRAGGSSDRGGTLVAGFRRYAEPHFWGGGPDTEPDAAADFRWDQVEVSAMGRIAGGPLEWRLEPGYETNDVGRGSDEEVPDLEDVAPAGLFGLAERTSFVRIGASATLDRTRVRVFQPRGFRATLGGTLYAGTGGTDAEFLRWNADLAGYLSLDDRRQLALRGIAELVRPQGGRGVPFTHLAALGARTNRGFDTWRFRDHDLLALQSEWRYEIWRSIHADLRQEGFLFLDAGVVAPRIHEMALSDVRMAWGFGMRTVRRQALAFLWYLALGGEGTRFRVALSWPF